MKCTKLVQPGEICGDEGRLCDECEAVEAHYQFIQYKKADAERAKLDLQKEGLQNSHKACDRLIGGYYD